MPLSAIKSRYVQHAQARLCQGDILRDVRLLEPTTSPGSEEIDVAKRDLPYVVVMTQDCDLEQDQDNRSNEKKQDDDKYLQAVLLCPAYQSLKVKTGTHLEALGLKMQQIKISRDWDLLKQNSLPRYHFLPEEPGIQLPELILDFKHFFTSPRAFMYMRYKTHYVTTLGPLFRESLSQRFAYFLSRIGLPEFEASAPAAPLAPAAPVPQAAAG